MPGKIKKQLVRQTNNGRNGGMQNELKKGLKNKEFERKNDFKPKPC